LHQSTKIAHPTAGCPLPDCRLPNTAGSTALGVYGSEENADIIAMSGLTRTIENDYRLTRRQCMMLGVLGLTRMMVPWARGADVDIKDDLESLSNLVQMEMRDGPLLVFRDFVADADNEVDRHIKRQWSQRSDLLTTLKDKIGSDQPIRLRVEETAVRLMFVPQGQTPAEAAYQRYCLDVTDFLFEICQQENMLSGIISPDTAYPFVSGDGLCAFLVHRLAKAYQAVCRFTAQSGRSVKYKVSGAIFSNHIGAVDLNIELLAQGQFGLSRSPFTIWQNAGSGLSALMAVPVEESLHYWLGTATDRQIADALEEKPPESLAEAKRLAQAWIAIEEAVVGGLVEDVIGRYCAKHNMALPVPLHEEMRPAIAVLPQYRYREEGIRLVHQLGFQKAIDMYLEDPGWFGDQLVQSAAA
jgi:hypothetical protein